MFFGCFYIAGKWDKGPLWCAWLIFYFPRRPQRRHVLDLAELESVVQLAVSEGDSSVYGMLGDAHTDLAELGKAGEYYDRCLEMD